MDALYFYAIAFILIWVVALLFRDKLKIDIQGPLLMRKTQKMRGFIDRVAKIKFNIKPRSFNVNLGFKKFEVNIGPTLSPWRVILNAGIPISFIFMFYTLIMLVTSLQTLFVAPQASLILPGVDIPGTPVYVPLIYGLIGLATVIVVHEFGHGILARVEGVRIKSIGVLLLAILPGAFVEPDEEDIEKSSRMSKLRIYAAGSVFNLILAVLCLFLIMGITNFAIPASFEDDGMEIMSVVPGSPASEFLKQGMVIQSINGYSTNNISKYSEVLETLKLGDTVTLGTDQGTYSIKTVTHPNNASRPYIGVRTTPNLDLREDVSVFGNLPWIWFYLKEIFYWVALLNLAVGTINLLPMKPLDGGLMFEELLSYKLSDKIVQPVVNSLSIFIILILAVSIIWGTGRGIMMMF